MLEELLTGELLPDVGAAEVRATELTAQLMALSSEEGGAPDPRESAATALRVRTLPGIADLWPNLVPEVSVYASDPDGRLLAGRADAVAFADGRPQVVLDWKSDLQASSSVQAGYLSQLADYVRSFGASRGALVYLTRGEVVWLEHADAKPPGCG
jgi:CRISPR-associated exonuclease Cas4